MTTSSDSSDALLQYYTSRAEVNYHFHPLPLLDLLYIETPKVASTAIKGILQKVQLKYDQDLSRIAELEDDPRLCHNRKMSPLPKFFEFDEETRARYLTSGDIRRIAVVRDPYSRVLSAYLNKIAPRVRPIYDILLERHDLSPDTVLGFADFLRLESSASPLEMNPHWRPQHMLLCYPTIKFDEIGRFDELSAFFERLLASIPTDLRPSAPPAARNASDAGGQLADYYTQDTIEMVREMYDADFSIYGFDSNPWWEPVSGGTE